MRAILRQAAERLASEPDAEAWSLPDGVHYRRRAFATGADIAASFPDRGLSTSGWGARLALSFPPIRAWLARADGLFRDDGEELLSDAVHPPTSFDEPGRVAQEERLRADRAAQPAIGALSAGLFDILRSRGFRAGLRRRPQLRRADRAVGGRLGSTTTRSCVSRATEAVR